MARLPYPKITSKANPQPPYPVKKPSPHYGSLNAIDKSYVEAYEFGAPDYGRSRRNRLAGRLNKSSYFANTDPQKLWDYFGRDAESDYGETSDSSYDDDEEVFVPYDGYQFSLPLENVEQLEARHRESIYQYQRAFERMGVSAMLWEQLMEDLEDNPSAKSQFDDLMMILTLYR